MCFTPPKRNGHVELNTKCFPAFTLTFNSAKNVSPPQDMPCMSNSAPSVCQHSVPSPLNRAVVSLGENEFKDTFTFDCKENEWTDHTFKGRPPTRRYQHHLLYHAKSNAVFVYGGIHRAQWYVESS